MKIVPHKTKFRAYYADSNPLWVVVEKRGRGPRGVWLCEVVNEPEEINGEMYDSDYLGRQDVFTTEDIIAYFKSTAEKDKN